MGKSPTISPTNTGRRWAQERGRARKLSATPSQVRPGLRVMGPHGPPWGGDLPGSVPASRDRHRTPAAPLTASSRCCFRRLRSQSGSGSLPPRRLSNTRGSDSFSFSASCARFPGRSGQKAWEGDRGRSKGWKENGADAAREEERTPQPTCPLDYNASSRESESSRSLPKMATPRSN